MEKIWVIIAIVFILVLFTQCQTQPVEKPNTPSSPIVECVYNHDCDTENEECLDGKCVPWDPLGGK